MSNNAKIGGVLTIVSGALGVLGGFFALLGILAVRSISGMPEFYYDYYYYPTDFLTFIAVFYAVIGISGLILGILGITGGVFALQKKRWGLALAGAITGCFTFLPCGVPAIIFVAMAKSEFPAKQPSGPPV